MCLAQNCPPSQPVLLWNSYSNLGQKIKPALSLFPGAGQYPESRFSTALCPTTLTLFQENSSFCCRSGQLLMTSGSSISSQSLRRPEAGPGQADSALWTKQGHCHGDTMHPNLPMNSHHCLGSPTTLHLLLYWCFFFVLEQQGAHHSNWFHGRTPGSGLNSS